VKSFAVLSVRERISGNSLATSPHNNKPTIVGTSILAELDPGMGISQLIFQFISSPLSRSKDKVCKRLVLHFFGKLIGTHGDYF
jgi:hypothetical protein